MMGSAEVVCSLSLPSPLPSFFPPPFLPLSTLPSLPWSLSPSLAVSRVSLHHSGWYGIPYVGKAALDLQRWPGLCLPSAEF